jgi:hypothetical protein
MKKIVVLSLFLIALAGMASATPVMCAVLMFSNTSGNTGSVCSVTPDPGFFISSLILTGSDDFTGLQSGSPSFVFSATLAQTSPVFGAVYCGGLFSALPCAVTITPSATVTGLNLASFALQLTGAANTVTGGSVVGDSINLTLDYGETRIPTTGTPEPTTLGLMGGALLGLGFLARGKK